jgi:hypothetical protein
VTALANDDYVTQLAALLKEQLRPEALVYTEYG